MYIMFFNMSNICKMILIYISGLSWVAKGINPSPYSTLSVFSFSFYFLFSSWQPTIKTRAEDCMSVLMGLGWI